MIILTIIGVILVIYGIFGLILHYAKAKTPDGKLILLPKWYLGLIVGIFIWLLSASIVKIDGQDVGVLMNTAGVSEEPLNAGWHILNPFTSKVHMMDRTMWVYTFSKDQKEGLKKDAEPIWTSTGNKIRLGFDLSVAWAINPAKAPIIYQNISEQDGDDNVKYNWIEENIIKSRTKSALTQVVANYTPDEVITSKRSQIQSEIFDKIKTELAQANLVLFSVDLREIRFEDAYAQEISNTQVAEQTVRTLSNQTKQKEEQLKQAEFDKQRTIKNAEAEAEALRIKGNAVSNNPKIVELEWIHKWNGVLPTYMMGGNANVLLGLKSF